MGVVAVTQTDVIVDDLRRRADQLESKGNTYGEDLGVPYRDAAEALREIADQYDRSDRQ